MMDESGRRDEHSLDDGQRRVVEQRWQTSGMVIGGPGTGKTTALIARVARLIGPGGPLAADELTVLTPSRQTASALRDRLALAVGGATSGSLAHSVPSFCFRLIRRAALEAEEDPPVLLTGADEDSLLRDLLDGDAEDEASRPSRWPEAVSAQVRATKGFRSEVRAFFAECTTQGLTPDAVAERARAQGIDVWASLAGLYRDVLRTRAAMRGAHRDAAGLITEGAALVARGVPLRIGGTEPVRAVLIDDAQELTTGGVRLVERLRRRGVSVTAFADPDVSSGSFRGATASGFSRLLRALPAPLVLETAHRSAPAIVDLVRTVTARIGASGVVSHRRAPEGVADDESVRAMIVAGPTEEFDAIARRLRERHLRDGVPWERCAVIAHDARQVRALETELAARDVPTGAMSTADALGGLRPVRDLLAVIELALEDPEQWTPESVEAVLSGVAGRFDPVRLRRLRTVLRHAELESEGLRPGRELLVSAMRRPIEFDLLDTPDARDAARVARTVETVRRDAQRGATPHELLWTVWERSGLARAWRRNAIGTGSGAQQAGRDLDAVVALFQAAKRFGERPQDATAAVPRFLREILYSEVADDRLEATVPAGAVHVMTPAAALAREFDTVVIAGVQDGIWPNTRLRGGLLQQWRLEELGARADGEPSAPSDRRRTVMHDELRLFVRALSRARCEVVVTAVDSDDATPSGLFEFLPDPVAVTAAQRHPFSLRGLVARHRRSLTETGIDAAERTHAAEQLALLARADVPGADPDQWYGVAPPSSHGPLYDPDHDPVRVSPSRLSRMEQCQLDWVIAELGGDSGSTGAGVGTLVHAALETATGIDEADLWQVVDDRWGELEFEAPWVGRATKSRARDLVRRLAVYLRRFEASGGRVLDAESRFRLVLPDVDPDAPGAPTILSGAIDRVELASDGSVVIVDLKTGAREPSTAAAVADHPQLGAYQLAVSEGAVPAASGHPFGGAKLLVLQVAAKSKDYADPTQGPFDAEQRDAFIGRVRTAASVMRSQTFIAPFEDHCRDEHTHGLCAIHTIGAVSGV